MGRKETDGWTIVTIAEGAAYGVRYADLDTTWAGARAIAGIVADAQPVEGALRVFYTGSATSEVDGRTCAEDRGNVMDDDGTRIPVADVGRIADVIDLAANEQAIADSVADWYAYAV